MTNIEYEYRTHESSLFRTPKSTYDIEIYREKSDSWEEYTFSGKIEDWFHSTAIEPADVDSWKASLRELRGHGRP